MSGYDISASVSTSSAANPVAQFGNVYGGGSRPNWTLITVAAIVGALLFALIWLKGKHK